MEKGKGRPKSSTDTLVTTHRDSERRNKCKNLLVREKKTRKFGGYLKKNIFFFFFFKKKWEGKIMIEL